MVYLVAQGPLPEQRWRRPIREGQMEIIGRGSAGWGVDWDSMISRQHAEISLIKNRLRVRKIESATNPLFFRGRQLPEFYVSPGEHFVIGETKFILVADRVMVTLDLPLPDAEETFHADYLRQVDYRDAGQKIAVLGQLPELISRSVNDADLYVHFVNLLMTGIRRANTVALVQVQTGKLSDPEAAVEVLHWDQRVLTEGDFQPSWKLIKRAIEAGETVLHKWNLPTAVGAGESTIAHEGDWAFVTPLHGELSAGWAIYVGGGLNMAADRLAAEGDEDLRDDIKFAELIAATLANLRQVKMLERNQASLRPFFSPVVLDAIAGQDPDEVLAPRECEVSVLFCDLRGFSRKSEKFAKDLHELLDRVSQALGVTTREILAERGVVGDFHGDAAMGFWGWPLPQPDRAVRACRAALKIQTYFQEFSVQSDHPLHEFRIGLGIASGNAVAGKIGTSDQVKVSVFGPVVNVASRLEHMTAQLRAGILIDETTAELVGQSDIEGAMRIRRLAIVQPYGMDNTITLHQVLPPPGQRSALADEDILAYESALKAFIDGDWSAAFEQLHEVPTEDQAKDFLTGFIAQHNRTPPDDWQGFIALKQK